MMAKSTINKPELETLSYKPKSVKRGFMGLGCNKPEQPKTGVAMFADKNGGVLANPEQPNQQLMIIKRIQGLMTCVNNELGGLEVVATTGGTTKEPLRLVRKALEEIDLFEKTTLFQLQKEYE